MSRTSLILAGLAAICAGFSVIFVIKTTCRFHPARGEISDVQHVLALLKSWEHQAADPGIGRVAEHISKLVEEHKEQKQQLKQLQEQLQQQAAQAAQAGAGGDSALQTLALAGLQCPIAHNTELWGNALVWGDSHKTKSMADCCAACHAHRATAARGGLERNGPNSTTCNTWVYCGDKERCGPRLGDCWLKHQDALPPGDVPLGNGTSMWSSGVIYDDLGREYERYGKVVLHTPVGPIAITLLPGLAPYVVRELRREVAMMGATGGTCFGCKLYRAEDFGIQGIIITPGAYMASGNFTPPAPMPKIPSGHVCRAGSAGSAHFFINFFEADWGEAMCWGKVEDLALSKEISKRPIRVKKSSNELSMLAEELFFTLRLEK
ncbi:hypothetical protein HXX76_013084 [Chlamydomonas incerta]|uniref:Uncharacterized protein n=1 Tax=Chlamydomonas incerta TaxID=51695 RepID=A0A835VRB4_CHLIN|nr:hypothetical protein HXX76_013084 [Chlamydomonas incerta]|eukprot:KAG2426327.1 hypothetical protein HXX76_013084 [Chlamydomonas incerta]